MILFAFMILGIIFLLWKSAVRFAWSMTKLLFGIGAFVISPVLGILVLAGMTGIVGLPEILVILFLICLFGYHRA